MKLETINKAIAIAQYLEMIDMAEDMLQTLHEGLYLLMFGEEMPEELSQEEHDAICNSRDLDGNEPSYTSEEVIRKLGLN